MYETAELASEWEMTCKGFQLTKLYDVEITQNFIDRTSTLDFKFDLWAERGFTESPYTKEPISSLPDMPWLKTLLGGPGCPERIHDCRDFGEAVQWNFFRTTRLVLYAIMLEMCRCMPEDSSASLEVFRRKVELGMITCVDEICENTLGHYTYPLKTKTTERLSIVDVPGIRGYALIWPLVMAGVYISQAGGHKLDVHNRVPWIRKALRFVSDELSIKRAMSFMDSIETPNLLARRAAHVEQSQRLRVVR